MEQVDEEDKSEEETQDSGRESESEEEEEMEEIADEDKEKAYDDKIDQGKVSLSIRRDFFLNFFLFLIKYLFR